MLAPVFQFVVEEARDGSSGGGGDGRLALRVGHGRVGLRTWRSGGTRMRVVPYHRHFCLNFAMWLWGWSEVIGKSCVEVGDVIIACDEVLGLTRA